MAKNAVTADLEPEVPAEEIEAASTEETPVVEPKAEEKPPEEKQEEKQEKYVPHQALHEERERRKEAQREAAELKRNQQVLNDRVAQLWQAVQQPRPEAPQFRDPDKDPDPIEALKHNQALLQQQAFQEQANRQRLEQQAQQQEGARRLASWGASQAQEYRKENPDFDDAYQHIRTVRAAELQEMGFAGEELLHALWQDEMTIFERAQRSGKNPAEIAFNMAKATGWQKKQIEKPAAEKIETLQKGTQAAKSLGSGGGQSGLPTPEQIAAMGDDEFEELKASLRSKGKRLSDVL